MLQEISNLLIKSKQLNVWVYRLDLKHGQVGGNKYFKLKYNIEEAKKRNKTKLLTFGGAFSNHIFAMASVGKLYDFETIGVIRGEETLPLNHVLQHAKNCGMHLEYVNRTQYRDKYNLRFTQELKEKFGDFYLIPEGGSNQLALKGCAEIRNEINVEWDFICTPCGTGGTLTGLTLSLEEHQKVLGFAVLKGANFLNDDVNSLFVEYQKNNPNSKLENLNFEIFLDYHFGGYAKKKPELEKFIQTFQNDYQILIEWVYSGKMFYGLFDLIENDYFPVGSKIVALHTGGVYSFSS